uniref:Putative secreted protein n=1 Tax=Anopheles darlingi TaxID=43151 RepID=A0A2M4D0B1_ANODA
MGRAIHGGSVRGGSVGSCSALCCSSFLPFSQASRRCCPEQQNASRCHVKPVVLAKQMETVWPMVLVKMRNGSFRSVICWSRCAGSSPIRLTCSTIRRASSTSSVTCRSSCFRPSISRSSTG